MTGKILTSVGCLLLLAAALTPSVLGHSERGVFAGDLGSGYLGPGTGIAGSVSGLYVGAAGPAIAIEAYTAPQGTLATGGMLCDAEVAHDGLAPPNEVNVDGLLQAGTGGSVPNTWDDGGAGGACHTHHYSTQGFNTFGCQPGTRAAGGSHVGTDIWVGASCDWKEDQGGLKGEQTLVVCLANSILALDPGNLVKDVLVLAQCVLDYVSCLVNLTGCMIPGIEICGADGSSDAIIYGSAGVGATLVPANFPVGFPVGWVQNPPAMPAACPAGGDTAGVFVWDTVGTNADFLEVWLALTGEIWTAPGGALRPAPPPCTPAIPANPIVTGGTPCVDPATGAHCAVFWLSVRDPVTGTAEQVCLLDLEGRPWQAG